MKNFFWDSTFKTLANLDTSQEVHESFLHHQRIFKPVLDQIKGVNISHAEKIKYIQKFSQEATTDPTKTTTMIKNALSENTTYNPDIDPIVTCIAKLWNDMPCVKNDALNTMVQPGQNSFTVLNEVPNLTNVFEASLQTNSPYKLETIRTNLSKVITEADFPYLIDLCAVFELNKPLVVLISTGGIASIAGLLVVVATNSELEIELKNIIVSAIHTKKCQISRINSPSSWIGTFFKMVPVTEGSFGFTINGLQASSTNKSPTFLQKPNTILGTSVKPGYYIGDVFFNFAGGVQKSIFLHIFELINAKK